MKSNNEKIEPITVAISGASGAQYGLRLAEFLLQANIPIYLLISKAAKMVISLETDYELPNHKEKLIGYLSKRWKVEAGLIKYFTQEDWTSPVASGSGDSQKMVVCPASSGTLSAIATGACNNLIERAADVFLKERRTLIVVHRETPLHQAHLQNMLAITQMGGVIMPASPGFYHNPNGVDDLIDFMVARILDHLKIEHQLMKKWGSS